VPNRISSDDFGTYFGTYFGNKILHDLQPLVGPYEFKQKYLEFVVTDGKTKSI